jgi:hypothetical protein
MRSLVMAIGLLITAVGILGIAAPSVPLQVAQSLLTLEALYVVAAIRVGVGLLFVWVAPGSRAPVALRILGVLIVIAGAVTPFIGLERWSAILAWWSTQGSTFMRVSMGMAVVLGLFIAYAVAPGRRTAA